MNFSLKKIVIIIIFIYSNICFSYDFSYKIIGGDKVTDLNKYPWMLALLGRNSYSYYTFCGGTYIGKGWVLTAAHCFYDSDNHIQNKFDNNVYVLYGTLNLNYGGEIVGVEKIYIHENYWNEHDFNDIALLKLKKDIEVSEATLLTNENYNLEIPGSIATLIGWGDTLIGEGVEISYDLMEVDVPIVSYEKCMASYGSEIKSFNLCTGYDEGGKDSCQGDSGGPVIVKNNENDLFIAGVVSWGNGCALPKYYGVNTRVTKYEDWIKHIVDNSITSDFKSIVMPDYDTMSLYIKNGTFDNDLLIPYNLKLCSNNELNTNDSLLKITQKFVSDKGFVESSVIFTQVNDNDSFYLVNNSNQYVEASSIISVYGNKVVYKINDNGNFDLDNTTGKIKTTLFKNMDFNYFGVKIDDTCFEGLTYSDYALEMPKDEIKFTYSAIENPEINYEVSDLKPIGLGKFRENLLSMKVALPVFKESVDLYIAVYAPSIIDKIFLLNSNNQPVPIDNGLVKWKTNVNEEISEYDIYKDVNIDDWPQGRYYFAVIAANPNDFSKKYLWITYFDK